MRPTNKRQVIKNKILKKSWCLQFTPDIDSKYINKENDMMITTQYNIPNSEHEKPAYFPSLSLSLSPSTPSNPTILEE